ncbi:MAG TPA: hypothetical protein VM510_04750 [Caulifigura sp.]|nr:hypothetical protein [Caulifigura sp.]
MPVSRRGFLAVALCLLAVVATTAPCGAQSFSPRYDGANARLVDFSHLPAATPRRFAVVGDVEHPGVYETTDKKVLRSRVLKRAGSQALMGDYYTYFNSGLSSQSASIFDAETTEAAHRDVIVVTAKKPRGTPQSSADFHVAIIGLATDPVVVRLPASQRSLSALFFRLNQHSEVAAGATVNGVKSSEPLKNGDVILVNSRVDRTALADCDAILPVQQLDPPGAAGNSALAEPAETVDPPVYASLPVLDAPPPVAMTPREEAPVDQLSKVASAGSSFDTVVATRAPELEAVQPILAPITEPTRGITHVQQTAARRGTVDQADFEAVTPAGAGVSIRSLVILLALGTLGLGIGLLWFASERRLRTFPQPVPVPVPTVDVAETDRDSMAEFSQLVRGELEVEDEPVVLPAKISLHGQAVGQKRLIIHPPESLAGPHFTKAAASRDAETATTSRQIPVTAGSSADVVQTPVRSRKDTEGLLDRVLLAMQREGRK